MTIDLDKIFTFLNSLGGMPKDGLVFVFCIALGFGLKRCPWLHNSSIPWVVMMAGALLLPMLSDWNKSDLHSVRVFILTQALVGFITGVVACLFYRVALKPMMAKFGVKPEDLDSDPPFPKEDGSNVKPPTENKTP